MKILAVKRHTFEVKLKSSIHICTHTITEEKAGRKQIKQWYQFNVGTEELSTFFSCSFWIFAHVLKCFLSKNNYSINEHQVT